MEPGRTCIVAEKSSASCASAVRDFGEDYQWTKLAQATESWPNIAQNKFGTPAIIFVKHIGKRSLD
jgi:hypothetical protein